MKILLAVSGGIDSMYMAERAPELFPGASFAVAHCNFGLRGDESDGDELFVRNWCALKGLECMVKRFNTASYAADKGISIEMAARDLRYAWFESLCDERGFDRVAVAHNANDNAETLILNLLRGTGTRGMRGMGDHGRIVRPLLDTSRTQIEAWMTGHGLAWREDSSNASVGYKRNRIRHEVFPAFEKINPSFLSTIASGMKHFAQVDDIADEYFRRVEPDVLDRSDTGAAILLKPLLSLSHWQYVLFRLLEGYGLDEATFESITDLLGSGRQIAGKTFEARGWKIVASTDRLLAVPREAASPEGTLTVSEPGTYRFMGRDIRVSIYPKPEGMQLKLPSGTLIADADKLKLPLLLRRWQAGDRMRPLGLKGSKKLSDLFVDLKWSLPQKESAIVATAPGAPSGSVAALLCERIDDSFRVTDSTEVILELAFTGREDPC